MVVEKVIIYPIMANGKFYNQGGPETHGETLEKGKKKGQAHARHLPINKRSDHGQ